MDLTDDDVVVTMHASNEMAFKLSIEVGFNLEGVSHEGLWAQIAKVLAVTESDYVIEDNGVQYFRVQAQCICPIHIREQYVKGVLRYTLDVVRGAWSSPTKEFSISDLS